MDYLYHYTNVETLALILSNHTIRFNALDHVDDLQEQETADIQNLGQFCFVSCWTDESNESMEITLSPKISAGNRIMVNSLVEKFNPSATIIESTYKGLIA